MISRPLFAPVTIPEALVAGWAAVAAGSQTVAVREPGRMAGRAGLRVLGAGADVLTHRPVHERRWLEPAGRVADRTIGVQPSMCTRRRMAGLAGRRRARVNPVLVAATAGHRLVLPAQRELGVVESRRLPAGGAVALHAAAGNPRYMPAGRTVARLAGGRMAGIDAVAVTLGAGHRLMLPAQRELGVVEVRRLPAGGAVALHAAAGDARYVPAGRPVARLAGGRMAGIDAVAVAERRPPSDAARSAGTWCG